MAEDIRADEHADDCLIHGYIGGGDEGCTCGAEPSAESELAQLRASLAQVTQERDDLRECVRAFLVAHGRFTSLEQERRQMPDLVARMVALVGDPNAD